MSAGDVATTTWTDGNVAVFSAGTDGTGTFTITLNATRSPTGITFEEGTVTISGGTQITLQGGGTIDVASGRTATISSVIAGSVGLTKANSGTLVLDGVNTYTGATTINAGTLQIGNNDRLPTSTALTLANAAGVTFDLNNKNQTIGSLSGGGTTGGTIDIGGAKTLTVGDSTSTTFAGVITQTGGSGKLTKVGTGTLTLSGANAYTGLTTISAGALRAANNTALGTVAGGVSVTSGAALELDGSAGALTIGAEALTLNATGLAATPGALRNVSGNNSYAGVVTLASASRINSDAGTLTIDSAGNITGATFGLTVGGAGNVTINDPIATTTGTLTKDGTGTLTLGAANTFSGKTTVNGGKLSIGADSGLGTAPGSAVADQFTLNGGTLQTTAGFTLNANRGITLGSSSGTIETTTGTLVYNGVVTGSGGLTKSGTGTLELGGTSGNNTYSGGTTLSGGGTLRLAKHNALGTGAVTLAGGTLEGNDRSATVGTLSLTDNSTLTLSSGGTAATLTFTAGTGTYTAGKSLTIYNWTPGAGGAGADDKVKFDLTSGGSVDSDFLNSVLWKAVGVGGADVTGSILLGTGLVEMVPVPEPATVFAGCLLVGILGWTERKRLRQLLPKRQSV